MAEIPLFPLNTVLFPGGPLSLRIFERRYLDLVRDCSASGDPFGVCLLVSGAEAGRPSEAVTVGTLATIQDFYTLPDGLLGIKAIGGKRFHASRSTVRDSGLMIGHGEVWEDEEHVELPVEFQTLATIVTRLFEQVGQLYPDASPEDYEDASWVGFRLAELLPMDMGEKQQMLEQTDPISRLESLVQMLPRFQVQ